MLRQILSYILLSSENILNFVFQVEFLKNQNENLKVKETQAEIVQMISFEGQTKSLDNQHSTKLCEAIEQVRVAKY